MSITQKRRGGVVAVFAAALALFAILASSSEAHAAQSGGSKKPTIVLVHGAWADASGFGAVVENLQKKGYPVIAPANPLRGVKTEIFQHIDLAAGRFWIADGGISCFCGDLPEDEQKLVQATQLSAAATLFTEKIDGTAWRTKPSHYILAKNDQTVHPDLERTAAERMGGTVTELESSHVPMVSQPDAVLEVVKTAAAAI